MTALFADAVGRAADISTLQFGLEWFPDGIGGGSSRYFSSVVAQLQAQRVAVKGIVAGRNAAARDDASGVRVVCAYDAPLLQRLRAARFAVRTFLASERVDVAASHFALFTFGCLDLVKDLPLVVHFHGPWAAESRVEGASRVASFAKHFVEKRVYARAQKAVVLSHAFADVLHRDYGVPLDRIAVVPGGVDAQRFAPAASQSEARVRLQLPRDRPLVVVVRRLVKRMGLERLIDAFADSTVRATGAMLVVVGGGPLLSDLRRRASDLRIGRNVRFAGRVPEDDLPLYYRAADVSIVPSVALEGFGLVVAESLACGTPALVTPVGGLPEAAGGLAKQLVLGGCTSADLARGLRDALTGELPLPTADACASYARTQFGWPVVADRIKAVYASVL